MMKKYYPNWNTEATPENGYDLTISYDLSELPVISNTKNTKDMSTSERKALKKEMKTKYKEI